MRDLYACRLPVQGDGAEAFDQLVNLISSAASGGVAGNGDAGNGDAGETRQEPHGSLILDGEEALRWRSVASPEGADRLWTLWWDRPYRLRPELIWTMTARVTLEGGQAAVILHVGLRAGGKRLFPLRFDVEPLALARTIIERFEVVEDGWPLLAEPSYACDRDGVRELVDLLLDPARVLPVILISPVSSVKGPMVDPEMVAQTLVGLAHVVVLDTQAITYTLTEFVGPALAVFGGSVRMWWPGLDPDSDPREHYLWTPAKLEEPRNQPFDRAMLRLLVNAASFRFGTAALEARIQAAIARQRRAEIDVLWARASDASLAAEWQDELERAWTENERLRSESTELMAQLATAQENLAAMASYRVDDIEPEGAQFESHTASAEPANMVEAVTWAERECPSLVLLGEALESAAKATYRQPGRAWRALLAMNEIAAAWRRDDLGMSFFDAFVERGFDFRSHVSGLALGRYGHEYERTYEGATVTMGPHLALGRGSAEACCRIYWWIDEARKTFVVGHVGNHLSDSTTG